MSTCKDCLHYEVCVHWCDSLQEIFKPKTYIPLDDNNDDYCQFFKNKADYMQIRNPKYKTMKITSIKIHGKWVKDRNKRTCSICGFLYLENGKTTFNFCPNCGTNMKGGVMI